MSEEQLHQWFIECFGPAQGEAVWHQVQNMPQEVLDQLLAQDPSQLPKPADVQAMVQAFSMSGMQTASDMMSASDKGPINIELATNLALSRAQQEGGSTAVTALDAQKVHAAASQANLWLDTACDFLPVNSNLKALTPQDWITGSMQGWATLASPVAKAMTDALCQVLSDRLGIDEDSGGQIQGMIAGGIPLPLPGEHHNPLDVISMLGNTSFSMQLGQAAGDVAREVRGSFDQAIALYPNPAGSIIVENVKRYAENLGIDLEEVLSFTALREIAHARLFSAVPWLSPRIVALIGKFARAIDIDLDAVEEQLREQTTMDPQSLAGAVNPINVSVELNDEQKEALHSLETLLALVEGWVDCVTWQAGMAHIPHLDQLTEMCRRERAVGSPAQTTFESLLGMRIHPKAMRQAAGLWEAKTRALGIEKRDATWSHPDKLPILPGKADSGASVASSAGGAGGAGGADGVPSETTANTASDTSAESSVNKKTDTTTDTAATAAEQSTPDNASTHDDSPSSSKMHSDASRNTLPHDVSDKQSVFSGNDSAQTDWDEALSELLMQEQSKSRDETVFNRNAADSEPVDDEPVGNDSTDGDPSDSQILGDTTTDNDPADNNPADGK